MGTSIVIFLIEKGLVLPSWTCFWLKFYICGGCCFCYVVKHSLWKIIKFVYFHFKSFHAIQHLVKIYLRRMGNFKLQWERCLKDLLVHPRRYFTLYSIVKDGDWLYFVFFFPQQSAQRRIRAIIQMSTAPSSGRGSRGPSTSRMQWGRS